VPHLHPQLTAARHFLDAHAARARAAHEAWPAPSTPALPPPPPPSQANKRAKLTSAAPAPPPEADEDEDEEEAFYVEMLLGHKRVKGVDMYLVKWEGARTHARARRALNANASDAATARACRNRLRASAQHVGASHVPGRGAAHIQVGSRRCQAASGRGEAHRTQARMKRSAVLPSRHCSGNLKRAHAHTLARVSTALPA
jgi:hypothetical protein